MNRLIQYCHQYNLGSQVQKVLIQCKRFQIVHGHTDILYQDEYRKIEQLIYQQRTEQEKQELIKDFEKLFLNLYLKELESDTIDPLIQSHMQEQKNIDFKLRKIMTEYIQIQIFQQQQEKEANDIVQKLLQLLQKFHFQQVWILEKYIQKLILKSQNPQIASKDYISDFCNKFFGNFLTFETLFKLYSSKHFQKYKIRADPNFKILMSFRSAQNFPMSPWIPQSLILTSQGVPNSPRFCKDSLLIAGRNQYDIQLSDIIDNKSFKSRLQFVILLSQLPRIKIYDYSFNGNLAVQILSDEKLVLEIGSRIGIFFNSLIEIVSLQQINSRWMVGVKKTTRKIKPDGQQQLKTTQLAPQPLRPNPKFGGLSVALIGKYGTISLDDPLLSPQVAYLTVQNQKLIFKRIDDQVSPCFKFLKNVEQCENYDIKAPPVGPVEITQIGDGRYKRIRWGFDHFNFNENWQMGKSLINAKHCRA